MSRDFLLCTSPKIQNVLLETLKYFVECCCELLVASCKHNSQIEINVGASAR